MRTRLPLAAILLAAYWGLIALLTHLPGGAGPGVPPPWDKLAHAAAYAGLAGLAAWVLAGRGPVTWRIAALVLGGAALYALLDELVQMLVPHRSADPWDWVADMLGAAAGLGVYVLVRSVGRRRAAA